MDLKALSIKLAEAEIEGSRFESLVITGEQDVLQVVVEDNNELPIFVTRTDEQILCISYLFEASEVDQDRIAELNATLLQLNIPVPLSAFALIDGRYSIFGALSVNSTFDDIAHEIATLADNAVDALEALEEFLV
jgi:uncharacterized protein YjfI (DUF2170 family)